MAEIMEDFYEELPANDIQEELYEDLPDSAYQASNQYPFPTPTSPISTGAAPPPLPTGPIPQHRPGGPSPTHEVSAPPLPTRAPSTTITTAQVVPPARKKGKAEAAKRKGATLPPPKSGGGGVDMKEILQRARARGDRDRALEELEHKKQRQEDSEDRHAAPWLNQLRKTRNSQVEVEVPSSDDVPEFLKKKQSLSRHDSDVNAVNKPSSPVPARKPPPPSAKPAVKPPPAAKPRVPHPAAFQPKNPEGAETGEKPPWLKQRERQLNIAKGGMETSDHDDGRPPPPSTKPPPSLPNGHTEHVAPPPLSKKPPRPIPMPRKPSEELPPVAAKPHSNDEFISQESPPLTPSSVRDRARTLERGMQRPPTPTSPAAPRIPVSVPPVQSSPGMPPRPKPAAKAPPSASPPTTPPVPVRNAPPPNSQLPPRFTPHPPPKELTPPRTLPQTQAEPTPLMGPVSKYRRSPLRSVDPFNRPSRPPVATKPQGYAHSIADDEDIYDDTIPLQQDGELETDDVYDDVSSALQPPESRPPPPLTPPPGPPSMDVPPPLPASLPPSSRPSVTSLVTDETRLNGTLPLSEIPEVSNGSILPEDDQETYEDLESAVDSYAVAALALASPSPSSTSLVPPSPQHSIGSSGSPTLQRKQKLTKDDKKKEKEKKRLEKEREKEKKKKDEIRMKNRLKGIKAFKQFDLKPNVEPLFAVEILLDHPKTKDHMNVTTGEIGRVLLLDHPKLPGDKYLIEKEDGTIGFLRKNISQRTAYQSVSSVLGTPQPEPVPTNELIEEDIYESLPQGDEDFPDATQAMPNLPPPNPSQAFRFPPPAQPAPPPPPSMDGPEDNYEYLPEPQAAN